MVVGSETTDSEVEADAGSEVEADAGSEVATDAGSEVEVDKAEVAESDCTGVGGMTVILSGIKNLWANQTLLMHPIKINQNYLSQPIT
jgi:hypothetical protein